MPNDIKSSENDFSRRSLLQLALVGGGVVVTAALPSSGEAATQINKKIVMYQETPKGAAHCSVCKQFVAPAACKIVAGPVSPNGWCNIFVPATKA